MEERKDSPQEEETKRDRPLFPPVSGPGITDGRSDGEDVEVFGGIAPSESL